MFMANKKCRHSLKDITKTNLQKVSKSFLSNLNYSLMYTLINIFKIDDIFLSIHLPVPNNIKAPNL